MSSERLKSRSVRLNFKEGVHLEDALFLALEILDATHAWQVCFDFNAVEIAVPTNGKTYADLHQFYTRKIKEKLSTKPERKPRPVVSSAQLAMLNRLITHSMYGPARTGKALVSKGFAEMKGRRFVINQAGYELLKTLGRAA